MIRIYYSDGRVASEGPFPARDVQVIVQEDERTGWFMLTGFDYYVQRGGWWIGVDIFGLFDFLLDSGVVLFGRTIDADEYDNIYQRARTDLNIVKSSWLPKERRVDNTAV